MKVFPIFGITHTYFNFEFYKKVIYIKTLELISKYYISLTNTNWKIHQKIILNYEPKNNSSPLNSSEYFSFFYQLRSLLIEFLVFKIY